MESECRKDGYYTARFKDVNGQQYEDIVYSLCGKVFQVYLSSARRLILVPVFPDSCLEILNDTRVDFL